MTAEVAIKNQHALVFAADSATTVTMWVQGEKQTRFENMSNPYKISMAQMTSAPQQQDSAAMAEYERRLRELTKTPVPPRQPTPPSPQSKPPERSNP